LEINEKASLLGGQWKVPNLVANGMFQAWWPLEGKGKTSFSHPSFFHFKRFYLNFIPIDFKVFTMVLKRYFVSFLLFL
jgi:hypothetical protein